MAYIIGLFLILAVIFSFGMGGNIKSSIMAEMSQIKTKAENWIAPKTQKEILIDNMKSDYSNLDKFFSNSAPSLLNSSAISSSDKAALQQAVDSYQSSKDTLSNLSTLEQSSQGVVSSIVNKVLNINQPATTTTNQQTTTQTTTSAQCPQQ